jgi:hypothetical protein
MNAHFKTKKEVKNLIEQVRYWKNKVTKLETKIKSLEDYKRGMVDTIYYLGGKGKK